MSDLPFSDEQPLGAARLSLAEAAQELQRALRSIERLSRSQEAQGAIQAAVLAVRQAELALQDAEAMFARETDELQAPEMQPDIDVDTAASDDLTDLETRQVSAAEQRGEPADSTPLMDEPTR